MDQTARLNLQRPTLTGSGDLGVTQLREAITDNANKLDGAAFYLPGMMMPYAGATAPNSEWKLADGSAISRTTYAGLFAVIGVTYGAGDGTTTFNLPDLRGRVPVGPDGTAGRLTSSDALGNTGGEQTHTLSATEIAAHTHAAGTLGTSSAGLHTHGSGGLTAAAGSHSHTPSGGGYFDVYSGGDGVGPNSGSGSQAMGASATTSTDGAHQHQIFSDGAHVHSVTGSTASSGSGGAHNNMQPYQVVNWLVKT